MFLEFGVSSLVPSVKSLMFWLSAGSAELKMPRNACTGAQRGKPAALLGVLSILAVLAATVVDVVTDKSFINLAPDIVYAQATGQATAKRPWNPANQQFSNVSALFLVPALSIT